MSTLFEVVLLAGILLAASGCTTTEPLQACDTPKPSLTSQEVAGRTLTTRMITVRGNKDKPAIVLIRAEEVIMSVPVKPEEWEVVDE